MTELDERIHEDLERLVTSAPLPPSVDDIIDRRPSVDRNRRPALVGLAAAAVLVAFFVGAVVLRQAAEDGGDTDENVAASPFSDLPPGATVPVPAPPLSERVVPQAVWTGREVVAWGGVGTGGATLDDGAAFDVETGTWRVVAPAPIEGRAFADVVWTGSEMVVWGGLSRDGTVVAGMYRQHPLADGAAYDPSTDTWRRIPDAPVDAATATSSVWTGDEVIVFGVAAGSHAAAYDPSTNEWRRLADPPALRSSEQSGEPIWTGAAVFATVDVFGAGPEGRVLVRYDPTSDSWQVDDPGYATLVGVPDSDGVSRTLIGLPLAVGQRVDVLDDTGLVTGHLPGAPVGIEVMDEAEGVWLGDEAQFVIRGDNGQFSEGTESWALDPGTRTWREVPGGLVIGSPMLTIADDMLFAWANFPDAEGARPVLYRTSDSTTAGPGGECGRMHLPTDTDGDGVADGCMRVRDAAAD